MDAQTRKPLIINACSLLLWTTLSAALATASYGVRENIEWAAYMTFSWLAVLYSILTLGLSFKDKTLTGAAQNSTLAMLFSGMVVAMLAPFYVGNWKNLDEPASFQKMDICTIVFSSFAIGGGYAYNSHLVAVIHKKWCQASTTL